MKQRIISAAVLIAVFVGLLYLHSWFLVCAIMMLSVVAQYEMIKAFKHAGIELESAVLYGFALLTMPIYYFYGLPAVFVLQMFSVCLIFVAGIIFRKTQNFDSIIASIFNLYYPQMFFVFFYMILFVKDANGGWDMDLSRLMMLVAIACAGMTDAFAYFAGRFFGKTPLCPEISPKKTVQGALGGLLGGVIGVQVVAILFDKGRVHLVEYLVFSFLLSVLAQVGDLAASLIKRRLGIKDYGNTIPGHGGFMDRIDSTLFILPIVYLFYHLYLGLG